MGKFFYILFSLLLFISCKRATLVKDVKTINSSDLISKDSVQTNLATKDPIMSRSESISKDPFALNDNVVKMTSSNSVYYIPIEINDTKMDIIFDTGASSISISETEALFLLKHGKLDEDDILSSISFQDATGTISNGTLINLKKVQIGNKVLNDIEATVVHNLDAPILLGQSALSKFGRLTIDYNKNEIIFE